MSYETKFSDWQERVEKASDKTQSASAAAAYLGIKYDTYKRYAKKYGCFKTNQSGSNFYFQLTVMSMLLDTTKDENIAKWLTINPK